MKSLPVTQPSCSQVLKGGPSAVLAENPVRDYRADFRLTHRTGSHGVIH